MSLKMNITYAMYWRRKLKSPRDSLLKLSLLVPQISLKIYYLEDLTSNCLKNSPQKAGNQRRYKNNYSPYSKICPYSLQNIVTKEDVFSKESNTTQNMMIVLTLEFPEKFYQNTFNFLTHKRIFLKNNFDKSGVNRIFIIHTEHNQIEKKNPFYSVRLY